MSSPLTSRVVPQLKAALSRLGTDPERRDLGSWTHRPSGVEAPLVLADTRGCLPGFLLSLIATKEKRDPPPPPLTVVVTPDEARASALASELQFFLGPSPLHEEGMTIPRATVLPQNADMAYGDLGPDTELELERLAVLFKLSQGFMGPFLILSGASLGQRLMPREAFEGLCDMVGPGETVDRRELVIKLDRAGYRQMPIVEDPGCYAVRGAIVDVYSPAMSHPCRLEFDGDTIIDLRRFHTESQRTVAHQSVLYIHPVRQTVVTSKETR